MVQLFALMLLLAQNAEVGPGAGTRLIHDRARAPTPVTDKFLIPTRPPNCRTAEEEQIALEQIRHGELGQCMVRDESEARRRGR